MHLVTHLYDVVPLLIDFLADFVVSAVIAYLSGGQHLRPLDVETFKLIRHLIIMA